MSYELDLAHLLKNVEQDESGCWIWQQSCGSHGYGQTWDGESVLLAHRAIYERTWGPIPSGYEVDHICHVKQCINPLHLEAVTPAENSKRTYDRGVRPLAAHCPAGHEYTADNTWVGRRRLASGDWGKYRECQICRQESKRAYQRRQQEVSAR